ncbi:hypothetical protein FB451DRAFT_1390383 [Mycena latifolia]|nr:hypothetical protein FB451DRAFT_1390383 [Mycena latifolia]
MNHEAQVHILKSEYAEAHSIHARLVRDTSVDRDATRHAHALINVAELDVMINADTEVVLENLNKARIIFTSTEYPTGLIFCDKILADLYLLMGKTCPTASSGSVI